MDNINIKISGHDVYKAVQNFLVNEQKVTREYIEQEIEKRMEKIIGRHIEEQFKANNIVSMIRAALANYFKEGVPPANGNMWQTRDVFDKWLKEEISKVIKQEVLSHYTIMLANDNKIFNVEKRNELR